MNIPFEMMTPLDSNMILEDGLYEIHAEVEWSNLIYGMRFFHVKHEPHPPCISELIEAKHLEKISGMKQRMTGHVTLTAGTEVQLEVWSDWNTEVVDYKWSFVKL